MAWWLFHVEVPLYVLDLLDLCQFAWLVCEADCFVCCGVQIQLLDGVEGVEQVGLLPSDAVFYGQVAEIWSKVCHYTPLPAAAGHLAVFERWFAGMVESATATMEERHERSDQTWAALC